MDFGTREEADKWYNRPNKKEGTEENKDEPETVEPLDLKVLRERYKDGILIESYGILPTDLVRVKLAAKDILALLDELINLRKQSNFSSWLALREWDPYDEFVPLYPQEWAEQLKENPRYSIKLGHYEPDVEEPISH
jgi:hypothetical protein